MDRKLRSVEQMPAEITQSLLGPAFADSSREGEDEASSVVDGPEGGVTRSPNC
jgi:hypothetical protein